MHAFHVKFALVGLIFPRMRRPTNATPRSLLHRSRGAASAHQQPRVQPGSLFAIAGVINCAALQSPSPPASPLPPLTIDDARTIFSYMFIHIPKTGGTSVEEALKDNAVLMANAVRWQVQRCCDAITLVGSCCWSRNGSPPWHLAPGVFQRRYQYSIEGHGQPRRPRWCAVRNPTARYASCVHGTTTFTTRMHTVPSPTYSHKNSREGALTPLGWHHCHHATAREELAHRQPQHWFVWDETGEVQCDCVVAIEKLGRIIAKHENTNHRQPRQLPLPTALEDVYKLDVDLWERARDSAGLCYHPEPRFPSPPPSWTCPVARRTT